MHEIILCAAIHYDDGIIYVHQPVNISSGIVVCGLRHCNCINTHYALTGKASKREDKQGFLTNRGRFVDRVEGFKIALAQGQITHNEGETEILMSEDLY